MNLGFWKKLKRPLLILAPMANVTDASFRRIIAKYGKPDVMWTEFVSADGLASLGKEKLLIDLEYTPKERPIVAQLFSAHPDKMEVAAKLVADLGFDGLDINMGCPDKAVMAQGAGGALIRTPKLAQEVIVAAKRGISKASKPKARNIPISVKTRIGYSKDEIKTWLPVLLEMDLAAITIHARTVKELSLVPARYEHVKEAVKLRDEVGVDTLIIGNGDMMSIADAKRKIKETGADGIMFGRAIFGNPWFFANRKYEPSVREKLEVLSEHAKLYERYFKKVKSFAYMKKHFKAYVSGFEGAKELRVKLMEEGNTAGEVSKIIKNYLKA